MTKMPMQRVFKLTDDRNWIMNQTGITVKKTLPDCSCIELYLKAIEYSGHLVMWYPEHKEQKNKRNRFSKEAYRQSYREVKRNRDKLKIINSLFTLQAGHDIPEVTQLLQETEDWNE